MDVLAGRHARACFCTSHVLLDTSRETHAWVCDRPMGGEAHSRNTKQQTTQQIDCVAIANHANMHLKLVFLTPACLVYGLTSSGVGLFHVRSSTVFLEIIRFLSLACRSYYIESFGDDGWHGLKTLTKQTSQVRC